jgi:DNA-binding response OmpR family regulator
MPGEILFVEMEIPEQRIDRVSGELGLASRLTDRGDLLRQVRATSPRIVVVNGDEHPERLFADIRYTRALSEVPLVALVPDRSTATDALRLGADSVVCLPVDDDELRLKVASLLRRTEGSRDPDVFDDGQIYFDRSQQLLLVGRAKVELTPTEFRMLSALLERPGVVIEHHEIMERVWGDAYRDRAEIKLYVSYLRRKLARAEIDPIETVRGVGYRYRPPGG